MRKLNISPEFWAFLIGINIGIIIKVNGKYYSFDWYDTRYWNFEDKVDADIDLIEVFPKEVTITEYVRN